MWVTGYGLKRLQKNLNNAAQKIALYSFTFQLFACPNKYLLVKGQKQCKLCSKVTRKIPECH